MGKTEQIILRERRLEEQGTWRKKWGRTVGNYGPARGYNKMAWLGMDNLKSVGR
jgi:hypothetical protein